MSVRTWVVAGRQVTDRAGIAEHLGLATNTVTQYFSPSGRRAYGTPEPLPAWVDGTEVFALDDLDAWNAARLRRGTRAEARPRVAPESAAELVGVREFAALRGVPKNTFRRYVADSLNAWERGEDGYLPRPDHASRYATRPDGRDRLVYQWRRDRAVAWAFPDRPRTGGRRPGPRPQVDDLRAILPATGPRPTLRELALELSARLHTEVSPRVVGRLVRRLHTDDTDSGG